MRQDFILFIDIYVRFINTLHTNSRLHFAKVKVIEVICKAKSVHLSVCF